MRSDWFATVDSLCHLLPGIGERVMCHNDRLCGFAKFEAWALIGRAAASAYHLPGKLLSSSAIEKAFSF
jgi:hypothetical protein